MHKWNAPTYTEEADRSDCWTTLLSSLKGFGEQNLFLSNFLNRSFERPISGSIQGQFAIQIHKRAHICRSLKY